MNSEWSDKILDSFVEEVVTGRHPPDLRAKIVSAWQQERAGYLPLPDRIEATGELIAPPIVAKSSHVPKPVVSLPAKRASHKWKVLLVVAASGVLVAWAVPWRAAFVSSKETVAVTPGINRAPSSGLPRASELPQIAEKTEPNFSKNGNREFTGEKLGIENVPFASGEPNQSIGKGWKSNSIASASRLSDEQIVELIDTQLETLWQQVKVTPESRLEVSRLAQSLSKTLTGQELPSTTVAELAELKSEAGRKQAVAQLITQAIDSQSFSRLWAEELVADWLRGGNLSLESAPVEQLERFVASGIAGDRPWNEVVSTVISGDVLVTAFAGGGNHRLASHLSGMFMNSSLGCVRCHEAKGHVGDASSQEQYWSLVATLMGLDVRTVEKSTARMAIDNQAKVFAETMKPSLFFDRPDGTLGAAKFRLPDGQPWQSVAGATTPRAALAKWIGDSNESDQAIVNQVWQVALGRSLVARNALVDDVGLTERSELQNLLAQQFRAHGRNLSQLVGWVVRSDAFARDSISVDRNLWLQATEAEIENWHLAEMTFAARTSLGEAQGGLESSLAAAVKWSQPNSEGGASVLAQPSLDPTVKPQALIKSDVVMPAAAYAIHRGRLSQNQQSYVASLVVSEKLTWEQKVEHIVSLSPSLTASGGVKRLSKELLETLGDPTAALTELMWAVQNADAS